MDGSKAQTAPEQVIVANTALARILAEELRMPLIEAEQSLAYARLEQDLGALTFAQNTLRNGLKLLDQYISSGELLRNDQELTNNTVTIGALLNEVVHRVQPITVLQGSDLIIDYSVVRQPVLVDIERVCTLLENLVSAFVRLPAKRIVLGAHVTKNGIRTGVFSDELTSNAFVSSMRDLASNISQSTHFSTTGSAHLLIADWLGQKLTLPITPGRHGNNRGVAITIPWSHQLSLL